jgi:hypothetical protein
MTEFFLKTLTQKEKVKLSYPGDSRKLKDFIDSLEIETKIKTQYDAILKQYIKFTYGIKNDDQVAINTIFTTINTYVSEDEVKRIIQNYARDQQKQKAITLLRNIAEDTKTEAIFCKVFEDNLIPFDTAAARLLGGHNDHVIHSAYVYLTGIYIIREVGFLGTLVKNVDHFSKKWAVISMFHDSGYPTEIGAKIMNQNLNWILNNQNQMENGSDPLVSFSFKRFRSYFIIPKMFYEIFDMTYVFGCMFDREDKASKKAGSYKIVDLIHIIGMYMSCKLYQGRISALTIREIIIEQYENNLAKGYVDHGLLSCIIVFQRVIQSMQAERKNIQEKGNFEEIVKTVSEVITAIYLHHNYRWLPEELKLKSFEPTSDNLTIFLLLLIDDLQMWHRGFEGKIKWEVTFEIKGHTFDSKSKATIRKKRKTVIFCKYKSIDLINFARNYRQIEKIRANFKKVFYKSVCVSHTIEANALKKTDNYLVDLLNLLKDPTKVKRETIKKYYIQLVEIVSVEEHGEQRHDVKILDEFIDVDLLRKDTENEPDYHKLKIEDVIENATISCYKKVDCQEAIEEQRSWFIERIISYCTVYRFNTEQLFQFSFNAKTNINIDVKIKADTKVETDYRTNLFNNFKKIVTLLKGLFNLLNVKAEVKNADN